MRATDKAVLSLAALLLFGGMVFVVFDAGRRYEQRQVRATCPDIGRRLVAVHMDRTGLICDYEPTTNRYGRAPVEQRRVPW